MKEAKKQGKHPKQDTTNSKLDTIHSGGDKRVTKKITQNELLEHDPLEEALHCYAQNPQHRGAVRETKAGGLRPLEEELLWGGLKEEEKTGRQSKSFDNHHRERMSEMEKDGMYFERQATEDFGERDDDNPNEQQVGSSEKPQKKKGFFKSVFGGIKSALGGGDKNSKKKEEELALQPKPQQQKGVPKSPKNQHQRRMVAENDSMSMKQEVLQEDSSVKSRKPVAEDMDD